MVSSVLFFHNRPGWYHQHSYGTKMIQVDCVWRSSALCLPADPHICTWKRHSHENQSQRELQGREGHAGHRVWGAVQLEGDFNNPSKDGNLSKMVVLTSSTKGHSYTSLCVSGSSVRDPHPKTFCDPERWGHPSLITLFSCAWTLTVLQTVFSVLPTSVNCSAETVGRIALHWGDPQMTATLKLYCD